MRHFILFSLLIFSSSFISFSQSLKGRISNLNGDAVQYATIYISELKQGTTSNVSGDYEIKLPKGEYNVIYQSLGHKPVSVNIIISGRTTIKNIILSEQMYEIPEVRITANGEDPAYNIMRKAIGMAPFYLNNISNYKAEVYLKGNLVIKKIPGLFKKSMSFEATGNHATISAGKRSSGNGNQIKEGDVFMMESFNEIEFTAPDKYLQKVISYNSTMPEQGNNISPMDYIKASFYQPVIADAAISPLSPQAFSHYNFKYRGATLEGNKTINKIEVIPKRKSQQLFEGYIYVLEDLWCLQSIDLTNNNFAGTISIKQLYVPVEEDIWMPISHEFEINLEIIGFRANVGYSSSVRYLNVQPNTSLHNPGLLSASVPVNPVAFTAKTDTSESKTKHQIDKILEKDELSDRDMIKLSRLMEKESQKSLRDSSKNSLEVFDNTTRIIEKDANKKDSTYWSNIRPIPLSDIEVLSIRRSDSLKTITKQQVTINNSDKVEEVKHENNTLNTIGHIFVGHTWSDTTGLSFNFGGIADLRNLSFNTVDGFVYGLDARLRKGWKPNKSLTIGTDIKRAFSRQMFMWRTNVNYNFFKNRQNELFLRMGQMSRDIGTGGSINTFLNSITSLFLKDNYLKLYSSDYAEFGYRTELTNGLNLELSIGFDNRRPLNNNSSFSIIKSSKDYTPNIPVNNYLAPGSGYMNTINSQRHTDFVTKVTYTPFSKYRINDGVKIFQGSEWPTFSILWEHGLNKTVGTSGGALNYDMLKFEASMHKDLGAFSEMRWRFRSGGFIDNRNVPFYDFFHFNSQSLPVLLNDYDDAFMLPAYYSLSTPEFFCESHFKYTTPYLAIKYLPLLSNSLMRENLSLSWLGSRFHTNYTEIGYSISEILFIGEAGVFFGFDDFRYKRTGIKLIFRFN